MLIIPGVPLVLATGVTFSPTPIRSEIAFTPPLPLPNSFRALGESTFALVYPSRGFAFWDLNSDGYSDPIVAPSWSRRERDANK